MGLNGWLVKVSWLWKLCQCSGGWNWIFSLWSAMKCPIVSSEVSGFGVTFGGLYFNAQGYVPELLEN